MPQKRHTIHTQMATKSIKVSEQAFILISELKGVETVDQLLTRVLTAEKNNTAQRENALKIGKLTTTKDKMSIIWANVKRYNEAQKTSKECNFYVLKAYGINATFGINRGRIGIFLEAIKSDYESHYKKMGVNPKEYKMHPNLSKKDNETVLGFMA